MLQKKDTIKDYNLRSVANEELCPVCIMKETQSYRGFPLSAARVFQFSVFFVDSNGILTWSVGWLFGARVIRKGHDAKL